MRELWIDSVGDTINGQFDAVVSTQKPDVPDHHLIQVVPIEALRQAEAEIKRLMEITTTTYSLADKLTAANAEIERLRKYIGDCEYEHPMKKLEAARAEISAKDAEIDRTLEQLKQANKWAYSLEGQLAEWKWEYENVSKFATDYENKLSEARAEIERLQKTIDSNKQLHQAPWCDGNERDELTAATALITTMREALK